MDHFGYYRVSALHPICIPISPLSCLSNPSILFFHPDSCCQHVMQLQQATVALCSYLLAWEAQLSPRKSVQDQIHMCGPKHTQLWVMCLRGRQLRPKERERSVHPHTNSHDTHGYDSPDPEELNSKVHGEFASP